MNNKFKRALETQNDKIDYYELGKQASTLRKWGKNLVLTFQTVFPSPEYLTGRVFLGGTIFAWSPPNSPSSWGLRCAPPFPGGRTQSHGQLQLFNPRVNSKALCKQAPAAS